MVWLHVHVEANTYVHVVVKNYVFKISSNNVFLSYTKNTAFFQTGTLLIEGIAPPLLCYIINASRTVFSMANLVSNDNQIELGYQMQCWPFVLKESYSFMCIQFKLKKPQVLLFVF